MNMTASAASGFQPPACYTSSNICTPRMTWVRRPIINRYWQTAHLSFSRDKNSVSFNYDAGYSFNDKAPLERWFRLGGFGRLSGLAPDQLTGRHSALVNLTYYRRLNNMDLL